jgi:hypothetical protein
LSWNKEKTAWGQTHETFYNLEQINELVLKHDNIATLIKYLVRILVNYTLEFLRFILFLTLGLAFKPIYFTPPHGSKILIGLAQGFASLII